MARNHETEVGILRWNSFLEWRLDMVDDFLKKSWSLRRNEWQGFVEWHVTDSVDAQSVGNSYSLSRIHLLLVRSVNLISIEERFYYEFYFFCFEWRDGHRPLCREDNSNRTRVSSSKLYPLAVSKRMSVVRDNIIWRTKTWSRFTLAKIPSAN